MVAEHGVRRGNKVRPEMADKKHLLQEMTWLEFAERIKDKPTLLLPFGSQEEQGPMAPMGDWMLVEILAERIAKQADVIAAPTVPFGYADYFRPIAGGVAFRPDTFRRILEDICENFLNHDLDHLVIFNGHSGNYPLIDQTIRKIKEERGVLIPCLNVWQLITPQMWEELHPGFGDQGLWPWRRSADIRVSASVARAHAHGFDRAGIGKGGDDRPADGRSQRREVSGR